jgi:hypothetical protein
LRIQFVKHANATFYPSRCSFYGQKETQKHAYARCIVINTTFFKGFNDPPSEHTSNLYSKNLKIKVLPQNPRLPGSGPGHLSGSLTVAVSLDVMRVARQERVERAARAVANGAAAERNGTEWTVVDVGGRSGKKINFDILILTPPSGIRTHDLSVLGQKRWPLCHAVLWQCSASKS